MVRPCPLPAPGARTTATQAEGARLRGGVRYSSASTSRSQATASTGVIAEDRSSSTRFGSTGRSAIIHAAAAGRGPNRGRGRVRPRRSDSHVQLGPQLREAVDVRDVRDLQDVVTIVTGIPRSGTSLVMQMLAAGGMPVLCDASRPPDADNPHGYFELEAVRATRRDASWLEDAAGRAVKVVHLLVPALPPDRRYRVVSVHRRLDEVLASQRAMLRRRGAPVDAGPGEARLAEILAAQLEEAERWVESVPGAALLRVRHADLLGDPAGAAQRLAAFLGRDLDRAAMAARVDPALHRQRAGASRS